MTTSETRSRLSTRALVGATLALLAASAGFADAQCTLAVPGSAAKLSIPFVPAYASCLNELGYDGTIECIGGSNFGGPCVVHSECPGGYCGDSVTQHPVGIPNVVNEDSWASCQPPGLAAEIESQSSATSWRFGAKGTATLTMQASKKAPASPPPPLPSVDVKLTLALSDIVSAAEPDGVTANGALRMVLRWTYKDRVQGDLTMIDYPASVPVAVEGGKVKLKTSLDTIRADVSMLPLSSCVITELRRVEIVDATNSLFARPGIFVP
jgi:hypothetical protein